MGDIVEKIGRLVRDPGVQVDVVGFIFALIVSALVGLIVSALYLLFYENRATGSQVHRCFPLLAPSITALFIAIQFSLPLSLGLLGALSIIRFRTPIKEPEEIGFIMLVISCSVVTATFQFLLLGVLLGLAIVLLVALRKLPGYFSLGAATDHGLALLTLRGDADSIEKQRALRILEANLANGRLQSVSYGENATTLHYSFTGVQAASLDTLQSSLRELRSVERLNLFFNRNGVLT